MPRRLQENDKKPNCRRAAAAMLAAIERGKTMDEAADGCQICLRLPSSRQSHGHLPCVDGDITAILAKYINAIFQGTSPGARITTNGAVQILLMDIPDHAAVAETVTACGRGEAPIGLINAVLRNSLLRKK